MICHFLLRRQRLCFAVARIFVRGLTYPEAVRESTRRMLRYSLPLVVLTAINGGWRQIFRQDKAQKRRNTGCILSFCNAVLAKKIRQQRRMALVSGSFPDVLLSLCAGGFAPLSTIYKIGHGCDRFYLGWQYFLKKCPYSMKRS